MMNERVSVVDERKRERVVEEVVNGSQGTVLVVRSVALSRS